MNIKTGFFDYSQPKIFLRFLSIATIFFQSHSFAQETADIDVGLNESVNSSAPVVVDGNSLFDVRGISSYPAELRAATISNRIQKVASNADISADSVKIIPEEDRLKIYAGDNFIMNVYDVDAEFERINKSLLAELIVKKTSDAIKIYRVERSRPVLIKHTLHAFAAAIVMIIVLFVLLWLIKKIDAKLQLKIKSKVESLENKSFNLIRSNQLWKAINVFFKTLKVLITLIVIAFFVQYIFNLFPWTKGAGMFLLRLFMNPLLSIGHGFLNFLPSLIFLIVIFIISRYVLKLTRLLFSGIEHGAIIIKNFHSDWAIPTFKIIRMVIVTFAVIIAYPYIPGSETSAFKGVSVFLGILISLGSSSFIGNVIAGYSMTYRRAFKKGDRIKVDDFIGFVEEQKLLLTRLRSFKNEEIIIPNSVLLNSSILNYNTRVEDLGLILHTSVGIGYETPWRLVDAMLKLAADRTEGLLKQPPPYVLMKSLGDFAVTYEINVYCNDVPKMHVYYTKLHQNILDIFNENNVQIMTPAYEGDPEKPKVVPKDQWDTRVK